MMYLTSFPLHSEGRICEGSDMRGSDMRGSTVALATNMQESLHVVLLLGMVHKIWV